MQEDPLVWLLPEAGEEERSRTRRLVTALRLLRDDARAVRSRCGAPGWERAKGELERFQRAHALRAIEGLLHAHLAAVLPRDSFLDLGAPALSYEDSWRVLLCRETPVLGALPSPGAGALEVGGRR
jgi:hypothetical protein